MYKITVPAQPGRRVTEWSGEGRGEERTCCKSGFKLLFLVMFLSSTSPCNFSETPNSSPIFFNEFLSLSKRESSTAFFPFLIPIILLPFQLRPFLSRQCYGSSLSTVPQSGSSSIQTVQSCLQHASKNIYLATNHHFFAISIYRSL